MTNIMRNNRGNTSILHMISLNTNIPSLTAKRAKKPVNCNAHKVTVNEELYGLMSAGAKAQDGRLLSIQTMLCRSAVPTARLLDEVVPKAKMDKALRTRAERHLVGTILLTARTNNTVNFQRREARPRKTYRRHCLVTTAGRISKRRVTVAKCGERLSSTKSTSTARPPIQVKTGTWCMGRPWCSFFR